MLKLNYQKIVMTNLSKIFDLKINKQHSKFSKRRNKNSKKIFKSENNYLFFTFFSESIFIGLEVNPLILL